MKMTPEEIVTALQTEYEGSESYRDSQLADEQAAAIDYYEGRPLGNEVEGRSQIVMNVVAETIDYMAISVLRLFVSGDQVVEFEATEEEFEEGAKEATETIGYNFMRKQDGYKILHSWLHSGLLERYGAVKTACETVERVTRKTVKVDENQLAFLDQGHYQDAELENYSDNEDGTFNAVLKYQKTEKQYIDIPIPTEEFRFSSRAKHEDDADYVAHICRKTRSELVEMGFDKDQVYDLPTHEADIIDERQYSRDRDDYWREEDSSPALEEVLLCEEYARMDVDGDGIAERVKVFRVADQILIDSETGKESIETIDEQPIVVFTPFPRAHRMVGNSLADKTMDIHSIKTVTARQLMDGMYSSNMPRPLVDMSNLHESTIDDLLTPVPGAPIRYNGQAPEPYQTNYDVSKSLAVLEYWNSEQESSSGVTRLNRGLNADALNGDTATEFKGLQEGAQQYEEFIARNFAECLSRLFAKKLRLMKREGEKFNIKMGGTYKQVDPTLWPEDFNVNIKVGLGTGRKDQRVQHRMMVLELQREAMEIGLTDNQRLYNAAGDLVRDLGLGQPDRYFVDPENAPPERQGEEKDPAVVEAEAKAQMEAQKLELEGQKTHAQLQMKQQENVAGIQLAMQKHQMDMQQKREQAELDDQLARDKADAELKLAQEKAAAEMVLARDKAAWEAQNKANMTDNRPGGDLDK